MNERPSPLQVPDLAPRLPRRGTRLTRAVARSLLRLTGWRFEGALPDLSKAVVIVAPHSSNWDFILGVIAMFALGARFSWLGKCSVFREPLGTVMRWLGGIPVDRSSSSGIVDQIAAVFNRSERLLLALSPEGTRRPVERWRTGFRHLARAAGVPVIPVAFDFGRRVIAILPVFEPTDDEAADLAALYALFAGITPRHRAGAGPWQPAPPGP